MEKYKIHHLFLTLSGSWSVTLKLRLPLLLFLSIKGVSIAIMTLEKITTYIQ